MTTCDRETLGFPWKFGTFLKAARDPLWNVLKPKHLDVSTKDADPYHLTHHPVPRKCPVKRNRSICYKHPWGWTRMVEGSTSNVEKQVASFENCVAYVAFFWGNGMERVYIYHIYYMIDISKISIFLGGLGVIVWWLSKQISDKIRFELVGDGWWFSGRHCLSFDEWIPQTATFGRTTSELCSKAHAFQYPFVKFLGCMWYAVGYSNATF